MNFGNFMIADMLWCSIVHQTYRCFTKRKHIYQPKWLGCWIAIYNGTDGGSRHQVHLYHGVQ